MLKLLKYFLFFSLLFSITSCYKDLGNYKYNEINQVTINADSSTLTVLQQDTLRVKIDLSQTMPDATELTYQWVLYQTNTPLTRRILDSTKDLNAVITEVPGSYTLDYFVTDKNTGVSFQKRFSVTVASAFGEGWLVLEETNGNTDLDLITSGGKVFKNIYSTTNAGEKLRSGTDKISILTTTRSDQEIYILSPNDMIQVHYVDFLKINDFTSLFFSAPAPQPEAVYMESFNKCLINNGQVYAISTNSPGPHFYGLSISGIGNYYMEPYEIYSVAKKFTYYDSLAQRFYNAGSRDIEFKPFSQYDPALDSFDMNNVGKKMIYAEKNNINLHFALFQNNNDDSLFIYAIDASSDHPAVGTYDVTNVPGLLNADHYQMSKTLSFLYYSNGNKMYKLDILAQTSTLLYTFPQDAQVADIQMYYNRKDNTDPDNNQLLAIATNEASGGKVYFFPLASTGNFEGNTYRKVYSGFNQINGITFKNRK